MSKLSSIIVDLIVRPTKTTLHTFNGIVFAWAFINICLGRIAFDPYPYNFLTLVLSWLAIVMTILIMINQIRQDKNQQRQDEQNQEVLETILLLSKATQLMLKDNKESIEHPTQRETK